MISIIVENLEIFSILGTGAQTTITAITYFMSMKMCFSSPISPSVQCSRSEVNTYDRCVDDKCDLCLDVDRTSTRLLEWCERGLLAYVLWVEKPSRIGPRKFYRLTCPIFSRYRSGSFRERNLVLMTWGGTDTTTSALGTVAVGRPWAYARWRSPNLSLEPWW